MQIEKILYEIELYLNLYKIQRFEFIELDVTFVKIRVILIIIHFQKRDEQR